MAERVTAAEVRASWCGEGDERFDRIAETLEWWEGRVPFGPRTGEDVAILAAYERGTRGYMVKVDAPAFSRVYDDEDEARGVANSYHDIYKRVRIVEEVEP